MSSVNGSLNGDLMVLRNGRSTSQVSIYNYPEHLNPFYEEDQHKRLRFWHINKKNKRSGADEGRRNSFSMSGLKDMWAFKSLRFSKKKSSTLGINKTSESPPTLRRQDIDSASSGDYTYDPHLRSSTSTPYNGYNSNDFQRNASYRSSLQNVTSSREGPANGLDFNRNNQYRSTIQFAQQRNGKTGHGGGGSLSATMTPQPHTRRYVGGSQTPQPQRYAEFDGRLTRGSSQCSVSTNPFETDDEDEEFAREHTPMPGTGGRTPRKKRRAPPPPAVPVHQPAGSVESSQHIGETTDGELRIVENLEEISNLTAEIESFVKTSNDTADNAETRESSSSPPPPAMVVVAAPMPQKRHTELEESEKVEKVKQANGSVTRETVVVEVVVNPPVVELVTEKQTVIITPPTPPSAIKKEADVQELKIVETPVVALRQTEEVLERKREERVAVQPPPRSASTTITTAPVRDEPAAGQVECIHVHVEENRCESPPRSDEPNRVSSFKPVTVQEEITTTATATETTIQQPAITTRTSFTVVRPPPKGQTHSINALHAHEPVTASETTPKRVPPPRPKPPLAVKPELVHVADVHKPNRRPKPSLDNGTSAAVTAHSSTMDTTTAAISDLAITTNEAGQQSPPAPLERLTTKRSTTATVEEVAYTPLVPSPEPLRIIESEENLFAPLGGDRLLYRPKPPRSHFEWKHSTLAPLESNLPPEKRKSVKDIIESINRSQRLLQAAAHKEQLPPPLNDDPPAYNGINSTPLMQRRKLSEPNNNFDDHRTQIDGGQSLQASRKLYSNPSMAEGYEGASALPTEPDGQKLNNAEIFQKCRVNKEAYDYDYRDRETSPTASNLDWNPLPKPKRTKNLNEI